MEKLLVPVDGSGSADHAVQHVIARLKSGAVAEVHLLHAQPPLVPRNVPDIAKPGLVERLSHDEAHHAFAAAKRLLEAAGVRYSTRTVFGDPAPEIALYADVNGCSEIVMGTRGMGTIRNLVLGSVAMKVLHLVNIPVTLVK